MSTNLRTDTVGRILRRHRNHVLIPIVIVLTIIAILSYTTNSPIGPTIDQVKESNQNKGAKISDYLIPGVPGLTAVIATFTFFYSGKMNDYRRDYIQRITDLEEFVAKTRRWLNSVEDTDGHITNCRNLTEQCYQYLENPNRRIPFTSIHVGIFSMVVIGVIVASLGMINLPYLDLFDILYALAVFGAGIIYLLKLWMMYEEIINLYNDEMLILNRFIGALKGIRD